MQSRGSVSATPSSGGSAPRRAAPCGVVRCHARRAGTRCQRTLLILPLSTSLMGVSARTTGHRKKTSPPPSGGAPRFEILSSSPASTPNRRRIGKATVRSASTEGSVSLFVTPSSVSINGFLANGARMVIGSRKYPIAFVGGHVCETCDQYSAPHHC